MIKYNIRPAIYDDIYITYEIKKNAFKEYVAKVWGWDEEFQLNYHNKDFRLDGLYIIEVENVPAGYFQIDTYKDKMYLRELYIIKECQGKSIGTDVICKLKEMSDSLNIPLALGVLKVNTKAKSLYERLGFKVYGEIENHYKMKYELLKK